MNDIEVDISDPTAARRYARFYLWLIGISLAVFAIAVVREPVYSPFGAIVIIGVYFLPFYFRWRKIARYLDDPKKAELIACALRQKGADFDGACQTLEERFSTMEQTLAVMANPTTWGRRQRLVTFRDDGVEVVVCEKNGLVGSLKAYLH